MNLKPRVRPILYGVFTYVAMVFAVSPLIGKAIYYVVPKPDEGLGSLGAIAVGFFAALFVGGVVSPILCGFVTARVAKDQPYLHFIYVVLVIGILMSAVLRWLHMSPAHNPYYWIFGVVSLLLASAATYSGAQRAAREADEALLESLRD